MALRTQFLNFDELYSYEHPADGKNELSSFHRIFFHNSFHVRRRAVLFLSVCRVPQTLPIEGGRRR